MGLLFKGRRRKKGAHIHMSLELNWISGNPVAAHRLEIRTWNVLVSQETDHRTLRTTFIPVFLFQMAMAFLVFFPFSFLFFSQS